MAQTNTVTIDGDATPDGITADTLCTRVIVWSKSSDVTGGYDKYQPASNSTPVRLDEGEKAIFYAGDGQVYRPGQTVGFLKTVNAGPFSLNKQCE